MLFKKKDDTVTVDDFKKEAKKRERIEAIKAKANSAVEWCKNHTTETVAIASAAAMGISSVCKFVSKERAIYADETLHRRQIYDHSKGHYYPLRREPKGYEWAEIDERHDNGESYYKILTSMKLLK